MSEYRSVYLRHRAGRAVVAALGLAFLAACGGNSDSSALDSDAELGRDLAMAQQDSVEPALQDVPVETPAPSQPAPAAKAPAPKPATKPAPTPAPQPAPPPQATTPAPAPEPIQGVVAAGTELEITTGSTVCSNTHGVGDKFTGTLNSAVTATNGVVIPQGTPAIFEVTEVKTAKNSNDDTFLRVRLVSVQYNGQTYPVTASIETVTTERTRTATKGTDAKKVAGGAILGAIVGQVIGKNTKGTVIGAAAGAAAGTAAAKATADFDTCLESGTTVTARLDAPVTVRMAPAR